MKMKLEKQLKSWQLNIVQQIALKIENKKLQENGNLYA